MNKKKNEHKNQKIKWKLPARVMRAETRQNIKKQGQMEGEKNIKHKQIQEMTQKNKDET